MRRLVYVPVALASLLLLPVAADAQASITGQVRDASGAVLPGVTVEASSPALIEKVRVVVTDGTGPGSRFCLRAPTAGHPVCARSARRSREGYGAAGSLQRAER